MFSTISRDNYEIHELYRKVTVSFLARDAFVRTNRRAIALMFVRPLVCLFVCLSVCPSVWDGRAL